MTANNISLPALNTEVKISFLQQQKGVVCIWREFWWHEHSHLEIGECCDNEIR